MTRILGAVLAGGEARRFGSDKALAEIGGERLIARAIATLAPQCDEVVVCGRTWPRVRSLADRPYRGLGPLGGLAAALALALEEGFDAVLSMPCDVPDPPRDLIGRLMPAPALLEACPVIGLWPAGLSIALDRHLAEGGGRSMRGWGAACGAREVALDRPLANINRPADLAAFLARPGREGGHDC